jgi:hypothetical protein
VAGLRGALVAVLLAAVLAGCDDDNPQPNIPDPTTSAPSTSTPPSTNTPTPTGPTEPALPDAATQNTDAGAEAFVRHWIELVNYAQVTGDTATLKSVNDSRCAGCTGLVGAIEEPYAQGGHIEGGAFRIGRLRALPLDHGADWAGFAKGSVDPQTVVSGNGETQTSTGSKIYFYAYVAWADSQWSMRWMRTPLPS